MWPIKEKENRQLLILWPKLNPYSKLHVGMHCYGSLISINSSELCYTAIGYSKCKENPGRRIPEKNLTIPAKNVISICSK